MRKIGERIKVLRKKKNLTQSELGVLLGFNEGGAAVRIAQYENNRKVPRYNIIEKLIFLFDINENALLSNHDDELMNVCIDMFWLGVNGIDILLVYKFFELFKDYSEEKYNQFNEIIKGIQ
ncbi:MAG: helix-turn-helix domain-containing protein [Erysipelotrichaceae bacterium]|nr:helix-turn-helix domain-containing protein [Erysipelotrichaceae bacterium]